MAAEMKHERLHTDVTLERYACYVDRATQCGHADTKDVQTRNPPVRSEGAYEIPEGVDGVNFTKAPVGDVLAMNPRSEPEDWEFVTGTALNTLIVGPPDATRRLVDGLRSQLAEPLIDISPHTQLAQRLMGYVGSIIAWDVDRLDWAAQQRLLEWLDGEGRTRVISTSSTPPIQLVATSAFLDRLYYRLNAVYINVILDSAARVSSSLEVS
jgi:Sigma-54 interaction domain